MTCLRHCPCRRAPAVPLGVPREQETAGAFLRRRPGGIVGKQACRGGTYLWLTSDLSAVQTEACGSCGKTRTLRLSRVRWRVLDGHGTGSFQRQHGGSAIAKAIGEGRIPARLARREPNRVLAVEVSPDGDLDDQRPGCCVSWNVRPRRPPCCHVRPAALPDDTASARDRSSPVSRTRWWDLPRATEGRV